MYPDLYWHDARQYASALQRLKTLGEVAVGTAGSRGGALRGFELAVVTRGSGFPARLDRPGCPVCLARLASLPTRVALQPHPIYTMRNPVAALVALLVHSGALDDLSSRSYPSHVG